jgi:triacylglycerol lipase
VHDGAVLSSLAPARRRLMLALFAVATVLIAVLAVVIVVRSNEPEAGSPARPVVQRRPGPVLLVPGYGGSTAALDQLAKVLRNSGRTAVVFHLPGDGRGDLRAQAKALGSAAGELRSARHAGSVDVIGYSAGGVVARLWVRDYGGASVARRVVSIGGPQHGTDVAAAARALLPSVCPVACRQLQPDSDLLVGLNRGDETPTGPAFVSIWTTRDEVVLPPASARLDGALNMTVQSICPSDAVGHGGLPTDAVVQAMVLRAVVAAAPARVTRAACPA